MPVNKAWVEDTVPATRKKESTWQYPYEVVQDLASGSLTDAVILMVRACRDPKRNMPTFNVEKHPSAGGNPLKMIALAPTRPAMRILVQGLKAAGAIPADTPYLYDERAAKKAGPARGQVTQVAPQPAPLRKRGQHPQEPQGGADGA